MIGLGRAVEFKRAFIISPLSGDVVRNIQYAKKCMHDAFARGYAPFAGHLLYPQVLNDNDPKERMFSMNAAYAFLETCSIALCYLDLGASTGMVADCLKGAELKVHIEYTSILGHIPRVDAIHGLALPHSHMPCATCQVEQENQK